MAYKNHIYLITSVNLGLLSYKMGCQPPCGSDQLVSLKCPVTIRGCKCISVLIIKDRNSAWEDDMHTWQENVLRWHLEFVLIVFHPHPTPAPASF